MISMEDGHFWLHSAYSVRRRVSVTKRSKVIIPQIRSDDKLSLKRNSNTWLSHPYLAVSGSLISVCSACFRHLTSHIGGLYRENYKSTVRPSLFKGISQMPSPVPSEASSNSEPHAKHSAVGATVTRIYYAVPTHYSSGESFADYAAAVEFAREKLTENSPACVDTRMVLAYPNNGGNVDFVFERNIITS